MSKRTGNRKPGRRVAKPASERSISKAKHGKTLAIFVHLDLATRSALERLGAHYDMGLGAVMRALIVEADGLVKAGRPPKVTP